MDIKGLEASAQTIRSLSIDAVQKANSGHPGLPMGCAELGSYVYGEVLTHYPQVSDWINRDRFVLSAGHGSMLVYSLLFMTGYGLTLDDIKDFRQLHSKTPGHPEYGWTNGVETTTGPLGQGLANSIGMAIAAKRHAQKYNKKEYEILSNRVITLVGDGDLMEGISYEACSLAGHLKLNNLIVIYDSNNITIEGKTDITFSENTRGRFEAAGWYVIEIDGHDYTQIGAAFEEADKARTSEQKPVIIIAKTTIGKSSPNKEGKNVCHGAPLGDDEAALTKEALGIDKNEKFYVNPEAIEYYKKRNDTLKEKYEQWQALFEKWSKEYPELRKDFDTTFNRTFDEAVFKDLPCLKTGEAAATRKVANQILNKITENLDFVVSGSADLAGSTMTYIKDKSCISSDNYTAANLQYGIREHAMGAIANGMYLFGGVFPIIGTFLSFCNYMRPAIRMAALMKLPIVYLFSHDSIFVGEDGPTHHPIEHLAELILIPNMNVMRPADCHEAAVAWEVAFKSKTTPSIIITSRHNIPTLDFDKLGDYKNAEKGAYIIKKEQGDTPDLIIIASGSEVFISLEAAEKLEAEGKSVRVISMFSTYLFERQSAEYKEEILPISIEKRLVIQAGTNMPWYKYIGLHGDSISINRFGLSGKGQDVANHFGINADSIYNKSKDMLG